MFSELQREKFRCVSPVGKPGDRKSTTINLAAHLAQLCLPDNAFIPASFSPESHFDEYDVEREGRPDKLLIGDDANSTLTDWQKTGNGERNAARFLKLYDCAPLSETFRRNKKEAPKGEAGAMRRFIPETSTNLLFGATFNIACSNVRKLRTGWKLLTGRWIIGKRITPVCWTDMGEREAR